MLRHYAKCSSCTRSYNCREWNKLTFWRWGNRCRERWWNIHQDTVSESQRWDTNPGRLSPRVHAPDHGGVCFFICVPLGRFLESGFQVWRKHDTYPHPKTKFDGSRTDDPGWSVAWLTGLVYEQWGQHNVLQNADGMTSSYSVVLSKPVALSPRFFPAVNIQPQYECLLSVSWVSEVLTWATVACGGRTETSVCPTGIHRLQVCFWVCFKMWIMLSLLYIHFLHIWISKVNTSEIFVQFPLNIHSEFINLKPCW